MASASPRIEGAGHAGLGRVIESTATAGRRCAVAAATPWRPVTAVTVGERATTPSPRWRRRAGTATLAPTMDETTLQRLLAAARAARRQAYAPYSRFAVGAAVLDEQGQVHAGCNVENAAYPQGVCAEAAALSAMVLSGGRRAAALLVVGEGPGLVTPCGGCRQKLREFGAPDTPVLVADGQGVQLWFTLGELLPHSFGPEHLKPNERPRHPANLASRIRALAPAARPRIAVLLGSGWGGLTQRLDEAQRLPYAELPGFPGAGVAAMPASCGWAGWVDVRCWCSAAGAMPTKTALPTA
jgi:cytidine deaminase